jgi:hypothetical protein
MNRASTVAVAGALVLSMGSNESEPGGPGASRMNNRNPVHVTPKNETLRLSDPATATGTCSAHL